MAENASLPSAALRAGGMTRRAEEGSLVAQKVALAPFGAQGRRDDSEGIELQKRQSGDWRSQGTAQSPVEVGEVLRR